MPTLLDRIADLIGLRDRDELDVAVVRLLAETLGTSANSLTILRPVGEESDLRWATPIRLSYGDAALLVDSHVGDTSALPRLAEREHHHDAVRTGQIYHYRDHAEVFTLFPLSALHEGLGVFEIGSSQPLSASQQQDVSSLLRIYHNFHGLLDYGERDTLTNLLNRKTFDSAFLKRALDVRLSEPHPVDNRRQNTAVGGHWLGVLDIDHFKQVNDTYGHLIGDEVLILMAQLMRSSFRFDDRIYRFGGEEFAVLIQCEQAAHARQAFERFRQRSEQHLFPQVGHITVSIGFTALRPDDTPSAAFERADKAVYYAKGHGRNQVCSHADLVASGDIVETLVDTTDAEYF